MVELNIQHYQLAKSSRGMLIVDEKNIHTSK
jgi:hypothetical protein